MKNKLTPITRRRLMVSAAATAILPHPFSAWAQSYPDRPVKLIVAFAPGGPSDIMGRYIAQKLTESTGKAFIVENLAAPGIRAQMVAMGFTAIGNQPEEFGRQIQSEVERWRKVIRESKLEA